MKNRVFSFLRKYRLCFLLSVILVVGMVIATIFNDLYVRRINDDFTFGLAAYYFFYVTPIFSFVYGGLSYAVVRKFWAPQFVLLLIHIIGAVFTVNVIFEFIVAAFFSLLGTELVALVFHLIKTTRDDYTFKTFDKQDKIDS